ncbi:DMT family transporter [Christensenellaceae bacterium OttesenSCG-928-L17]|nr:DMT family transporter [Christensenellaceae bacterium OttesenSCG-928-L17]
MFLCAIMWSISGFLTKLIPWHPMVISGTRCILSAAVLGIYMRMIGIKPVFNKNACLLALDVALIFVLYMPAVKLTTAANAIVMQYTAPIYVLLFSAIVYKQRVRRGDILTVVLTVAGIALFFFDQLGAGSTTGNIMALASGVFLGGMFFLGSKITEQERLSGLLFAQIFSVFIGLPFAFFSENPITTTSLIYIVLLGVVQLGLPYVLYTRAARHCPALQCSLISVIEPLLNPLWVFLIIGERLSVYALVGGFVVLATVTGWTIWDDRQKQNNR